VEEPLEGVEPLAGVVLPQQAQAVAALGSRGLLAGQLRSPVSYPLLPCSGHWAPARPSSQAVCCCASVGWRCCSLPFFLIFRMFSLSYLYCEIALQRPLLSCVSHSTKLVSVLQLLLVSGRDWRKLLSEASVSTEILRAPFVALWKLGSRHYNHLVLVAAPAAVVLAHSCWHHSGGQLVV